MEARVICAECIYFSFRDQKKMPVKFSNHGMGNCQHDIPATYYNAKFERNCKKFDLAESEVIESRVIFLKSIEEKLNGKNNTD